MKQIGASILSCSQAKVKRCLKSITVSIVNPAQVKDFGRGLAVRTKNDRIDSTVLARYGALVKPRPWQPPTPEVCTLKAFLARRNAVFQDLQRARNRLEKAEISKPPQMIIQSIKDTIAFHELELKRLEKSINDHILLNTYSR